MSRLMPPVSQSHQIIINAAGTNRTFTFGTDATFSSPGNINIGNTTNTYKAIINAANITTADKTFTLNNRTGTLALEDLTSLLAMLPATSGNSGKVLSNDGATTLSWISPGTTSLTSLNGISCSTYATQTLATTVTSGTNTGPTWVSISNNTNTHTLNIPLASNATTTVGGLLTNTEYVALAKVGVTNTFSQPQTFNGTASTFSVPPQITTPGTGTNDVATYGQVLAARNGISIRLPVDALDTASTALATANPTIGGVVIALGNRVLATALTTGANKVYKATGSLSAIVWALETDGQAQDGTPTDGDIIFVRSGTNADQQWAYNGTAWVLYNTSAAYTFSTGLTVTGNTITVSYGTTAGTACVGNDSRLSDSRTPTAHVLDGALHTISGKTAGQVMIATAATTYGFVTFSGDISSISAAGAVTIGKINGIVINNLGIQQNSSAIVTSGPTLVPSCLWAIATYRTIRIQFSITQGANYCSGYIVLMHDGTTPRITYIEDDAIGTISLVFTTDINATNIRLLCTNSGVAATMKYTVEAYPV